MARTEARISADIWEDGAYRDLSPMAQWAYEFLLSQRDLAHDGVIGLRVRRWSRHARGLTEGQLDDALAELEAARFVVIDRDTEELLIRSLIRRDKIYRQPNVLRAAADHLPLVLSATLRQSLANELARIAEEPMPDGSVAIVAEMRSALPNPSGNPSANPSRNPSPEGIEHPSPATPGVRGVVTAVSNGFPVPRSPKSPDPEPRDAPAARPPRARDRTADDPAFDRFWAAYPRREAKGAARKAWDRAVTRADPALIVAAAERYRDQPGREQRFTAHAATWLNADRWHDEPPGPARASPGQREHNGLMLDDRSIADQQRKHRLAALEAAQLSIEG